MAAVREAIAGAVRAVVLPSGAGRLTCTGYTPDSITAPCFFVAEYTVAYDKAFGRALDEAELTCRVLVGRADDQTSQRLLDAMLSGAGPASIKAALVAARGAPGEEALDGHADDVHLERVQSVRWYEHQGTTYVGAELIVKVIGDGRD
ncbi:hypothetical protein [Streptomyces sp. H27-H5]|uniref:hypothetical protein n=1 Tax=Streptomyces sp. H27-H5 TaxID=2996460 RepID=UPI002271076B|nr:hypothetical protein [Streptomyces sp. H27-H5]MCY0962979.1 hypothetical protein [Streptomyces sp. H27-H5]